MGLHNTPRCCAQRRMGRKLTDGGLLRYRKWVPQQLGDVIKQGSGDSRPMRARHRDTAANHNSTHFFGVVDRTRTHFFGRPDGKLFLSFLPLLLWVKQHSEMWDKTIMKLKLWAATFIAALQLFWLKQENRQQKTHTHSTHVPRAELQLLWH